MRKTNQSRNEAIISLYADGLTYSQIAKRVGASRCVVAGVIHRAPIEKRQGPNVPSASEIAATNRLIVAGLRRGLKQRDIAGELGLSQSTISGRIKGYGLREATDAQA